jgi:hypothetical protein
VRSLADLQRDFADALFAPEGDAPAFARDGAGPAAERMDVYRRAVLANYHKALGATYPVARRILGAPAFAAAVDAYVRAHPSTCGDLNDYGDDFGIFLAAHPPIAGQPCLRDIARVEWAIDEVNRAADPLTPPDQVLAALAAVPAERLPALSLRLAARCRLIGSDYPVFSLWQANQPDREREDGAPPGIAPEALCVRRDADGITLERLSPGEFAWLVALADGVPLAGAIDAARNAEPSFDLGHALHKYIGNGTIASLVEDWNASRQC